MKNALRALGAALLIFGVVLVGRGCFHPSAVREETRVEIDLDEPAIARRLSEAIRFRTISPPPPAQADLGTFRQFIAWLEVAYPKIHQSLEREILAEASLLFTWPGTDPAAKPVLLTAHHDVVPVNEGTEEDWVHPPFSGAIEDGVVWGRGALDDKGSMIAILEAVTYLLEQGFRPARTVYLAFGHDEEIGGREGAGAITEVLRGRGVRLAWSLDEGSFLIKDAFPGVENPLASVNVAEKGYLTIELVVAGVGGHSSMPPAEPAVSRLAAALVRLQNAPLPGGLDGLAAKSMSAAVGEMPLTTRILFANQWLFGGLVESQLEARPATNAVLRTTTAPTMLRASAKANVLPAEAVATVNFRIHPRDSSDGVLEHVRTAIADDHVEIRLPRPPGEPSKVSSTESAGYDAILRAAAEVYGPVVAMPGLTVGGTDSKHYGQIADDAYRFIPMVATPDIASTIHGTNEKVSIENLAQGTRGYIQILRNGAGGPS